MLLDPAPRPGRKVTGGNLAFYAVKMLRSGGRSTGERRNDPMHPKAQLNGTCSVQSFEEPIGLGETDEPLTLGESRAAQTEDPSVAATRRLDWKPMVAALDPTAPSCPTGFFVVIKKEPTNGVSLRFLALFRRSVERIIAEILRDPHVVGNGRIDFVSGVKSLAIYRSDFQLGGRLLSR